MPDKVTVDLHGVPETMLWTLYHRALEARRADSVLADPRAVALLDTIDYPFAERFGARPTALAQLQALRVRAFDAEIRRFLAGHPGGTVVALGEGLETQFWRVDDGRVHWLTVDLPESTAVRERLLPADTGRQRVLACSALDPRWAAEVDASHGVLVTAQGLLMYLDPPQVRTLIGDCARRFPDGGLVFDAMPRWLAAATRDGVSEPGGYQAPPWRWSMNADERDALRAGDPNIEQAWGVRLPRGRGPLGRVAPWLGSVPLLGAKLPSVTRLHFARHTT